MKPNRIYFEEAALSYPLGEKLKSMYCDVEWRPIASHNKIDELRQNPNSAFPEMKRYLIIGVRKTHKYVPNQKSSDFLVPYTSSGCTAMCLYCYLVCNYNKCAYLRLFVNREEMMERLLKTDTKTEGKCTFEIGSNSDLVLENTITGNLPWTIETFGRKGKGHITFPTKFSMVDPLLTLKHQGKTVVRMSVNPQDIISEIEIGTSSLENRILAVNHLAEAGYPVGLLIAPVILTDGWKEKYINLLDELQEKLSKKVKNNVFIECILMTYSYVHRAINSEAFPKAPELYDQTTMTGRGRGKYCYRPEVRKVAEAFLRQEIGKRFGVDKILYIS